MKANAKESLTDKSKTGKAHSSKHHTVNKDDGHCYCPTCGHDKGKGLYVRQAACDECNKRNGERKLEMRA